VEVRGASDGSLIGVRVRPRSRPGIAASDGVLTVSVASPPVDGRATEEARRALARALDVPVSAVTLRSGARARRKVFAVRGLAPDVAEVRLASACR
jgi:uncharacterized protein